MMIADERLDKLGDYFVLLSIGKRYNMTFEQFIIVVDSGRWEEFHR